MNCGFFTCEGHESSGKEIVCREGESLRTVISDELTCSFDWEGELMSFLISSEWTSYDEWEGEAVSDRFFNEGSINENNDEPVIQDDSSWCWCST